MSEHANKVVIVTGGASGIGRQTVKEFVIQGAKVALADLNRAAGEEYATELRDAGHDVLFLYADVSKEADCENLIRTVVEHFGRLDVLVNNVGIEISTPIHEMPLNEWEKMQAVNVTSVFLNTKHALRVFLEQGGGTIVNVCSVSGLVAWPNIAAYNATKGGVLMLTKSIAIDYAKHNIRCNCVCPSIVDTPFTNASIGAENLEAIKKEKAKLNPIGRLGTPEDVANAILFLASDKASFITGSALTVDGGYTAI
ncbi:glucose 1-dehydrogenase [Tumebacillus sp. DT12]|uniref:Glucose 1-dehydrogenase n=1 Tax=Tumebacillus lacus TaxID=2995335 RepID=A0ABT3X064_9BACL|nr:glucose 1-dehydrogenase [Tumebacillus lacus]MCX7569397.1 glucose 1-dehydrogenase [Tumebacillus lacus]